MSEMPEIQTDEVQAQLGEAFDFSYNNHYTHTENSRSEPRSSFAGFSDTMTPMNERILIPEKRRPSGALNRQRLQRPLDPRDFSITDISLGPTHSKFDNLPSILRHHAQTLQKQNAFIALDSRGKEISALTWETLSGRAEKVAQVIRDKSGLYRGDRVGLYYNDSEIMNFVVALLGCFLAGVVAVPMNPASPFKDINHILNSTQCHLVLTTDANLKILHRTLATQKLQWPKGIEWWKTNEFGSYQGITKKSKKNDPPALQVPDLAYIEFSRSPVGELRGVVHSHRTILHQMTCLKAMLNSKTPNETNPKSQWVLCNLDIRQSIGLVIGILLTIFSGNTTVWIPQLTLATGGLYANIITRYRINIILSDYPGLKQVAYNYQSFPHLTRNFSKKQTVDLSSINWCLIDALTVDPEFHEILQDRWLKPLGNKHYRDVVAPLLTLSEHGGMVIAMRDWLRGQERLGCHLEVPSMDDENCGPTDLSEVLLDKASLATNSVKIVTSSPSRNSISEDNSKYIRVGGFGYPLPDSTLAIVNPETCILAPEMQLGEIWIDSPSLSGGFWGLGKETSMVFHAVCSDSQGPIDMEFLRTGLLGFIFNGKVYVLGLYEDRLRQKVDWDNPEEVAEIRKTRIPESIGMEYRYHYTSHLVNTIMRGVTKVFDCSAFDTLVNGEYLPVLVLESTAASVPAPGAKYAFGELDELCEKAMNTLFKDHKLRVYCVLITPPNSLPRIVRSGRSEIGNMLCKRKFELGILPAVYVKFGIDKAIRSLPVGQDMEGGIWSPLVSQYRTDTLYGNEKQFSSVDFRPTVIDDRTLAPLSEFDSIIHILQWRVMHQPDELAFKTIDNKTKEGSGLSWRKFDHKVATVALALQSKLQLVPGDHVILMHTHSEDFIVAVYACLVTGIIAIPVSPIDSTRLQEDVPALLNIIKDYSVKSILINTETDAALKVKIVATHLKQSSNVARIQIPEFFNTKKLKLVNSECQELGLTPRKEWLTSNHVAIVWLHWTPDHRRVAVGVSHKTIMSVAKIQKETCQMSSTKPLVGCVRSTSGLGFIHTCIMGVYLGTSTLIVSPIDFALNPLSFFLTLSRYKVKDTYSTPQMIDHTCVSIRPEHFNLSDTKNLVIAFDNRPRTDITRRVRNLFTPTGLEISSINLAYSHVINPMVTTRSYMSIGPIDLYLDPEALRQGYVSAVNPKHCPNALHLHDSGRVPIGTQVAIVNPETCRVCSAGEYGEIWVYSEGNVVSFYKSKDQFSEERFSGRLADENGSDITYVRTGDLGFLHTTTELLAGGKPVDVQSLFVLGSIGETFEVLGLCHFPLDIERSVENCNKSIIRGGSAIFQAGGLIILVVECVQSSYLAALVPVIVNTVLDRHQFVIDIVAFVGKGDFPRSRLNEKQRGKVLASWVTRKLRTRGIYGVCQGERNLMNSLNFRPTSPGFRVPSGIHPAAAAAAVEATMGSGGTSGQPGSSNSVSPFGTIVGHDVYDSSSSAPIDMASVVSGHSEFANLRRRNEGGDGGSGIINDGGSGSGSYAYSSVIPGSGTEVRPSSFYLNDNRAMNIPQGSNTGSFYQQQSAKTMKL